MAETWTDATGKVWELKDMDESHIYNCINMMDDIIEGGERYLSRLRMFDGGSAEDDLEKLTESNERLLSKAKQKLQALKDEARKRQGEELPF